MLGGEGLGDPYTRPAEPQPPSYHVGRAAFLFPGHKCVASRLSLCLAHHPEAGISETPGENPQVPLGEKRHIKKNMRRDNTP